MYQFLGIKVSSRKNSGTRKKGKFNIQQMIDIIIFALTIVQMTIYQISNFTNMEC